MTMLCGDNNDDVLQSSAMIAALEVSGAVKTAASAALCSPRRRRGEDIHDASAVQPTTMTL
eukprot:2096376-Pleurochrysis_carterae.AAC.1